MSRTELTTFIPSLLFGFALAQSPPLFAATSIVGDIFFTPILPQGPIYIPIFLDVGNRDRPAPGFYHQSILLEKAAEKYRKSLKIDFEGTLEPNNKAKKAYIFQPDFQY